jgi:hypothetical protein
MSSIVLEMSQKIGCEYTDEKMNALVRALSPERLGHYAEIISSDRVRQLELYVWNSALSGALYTPIQGLEIVARNFFHHELSNHYGDEWYNNTKIKFIYPYQQKLAQAKETLKKENKSFTPSNIISSLSFGFWVGLLTSKYETSLWRTSLYKAFANKPAMPFLRKSVYHDFNLIRNLRNRIAHHEPILRPDLSHHNSRIIKMIGWFCKETAYWIDTQNRFKSIWNMPVNPFM